MVAGAHRRGARAAQRNRHDFDRSRCDAGGLPAGKPNPRFAARARQPGEVIRRDRLITVSPNRDPGVKGEQSLAPRGIYGALPARIERDANSVSLGLELVGFTAAPDVDVDLRTREIHGCPGGWIDGVDDERSSCGGGGDGREKEERSKARDDPFTH